MNRIYSSLKITLVLVAYGLFLISGHSQTTYTWTAAGGNFQIPSNWSPNRTSPATNDVLSIGGAGITITNVPSQTIGRLIIAGTGAKTFQPATTVSAVNFSVSGGVSPNLLLTNQDLTFSTLAGTAFNINVSDATIGASRTLTINNGIAFSVSGVFINSSAIANTGSIIFGSNSVYNHATNAGAIPLATWQTGSTVSFTGMPSGNSTAPMYTNLSQNYYNVVINTNLTANSGLNASITVSGTLNIITTGGFALRINNNNTGTYNLVANNYNQTGGDLVMAITNFVGNLVVSGNFNQSGGKISTLSSAVSQILLNGSSNQNFNAVDIGSTGNVLSLGVANTGSAGNNNIILQNDLSLTTLTSLILTNGVLSVGGKNLTVNKNLAISNGSIFAPIGNLFLLNSAVSSVAGIINNVFVNGTGGVSIVANSTINGVLSVAGETFTVGNNTLTLSNTSIVGTLGNFVTNATSSLILRGSSVISVPGVATGSRVVGALSINSSNDAILASNTSITGNLTLNGGVLLLGVNNISVAGSVLGSFSSASMVSQNGTGKLFKTYTFLPSSFYFPLGKGSISASTNIFAPVNIVSLTATAPASGYISIADNATPPAIPNIYDGNYAIKRYWTFDAPGLSSVNASMNTTYTGSDLALTGTEASYITGYNISPNTTWTRGLTSEVVSRAVNFNLINATALSGNYGVGAPIAFSTATLYSYQNGSWSDPNVWTEDPSGTTLLNPAVPASTSQVYILNGRSVFLTQNITTTGHTLVINSGGTLDLKTFSVTSFAGLSGQGLLRLNSANFPAVAVNSFFNAGQGTVEYYNLSTTLPTSVTTYNNLWLTKDDNSSNTFVYTLATNLITNGDLRVRNLLSAGTSGLSVGNSTTARTITVYGSLVVGDPAGGASNSVLSIAGFNTQHAMNLYGDLLNYGTLDLSNDAQYATPTQSMDLFFLGSTNNTFFCDGPTYIFDLDVNKGTDQTYILYLYASNPNYFKFFSNGKGLDIDKGTLRLGNNIVLDRLINGTNNYDIGTGQGATKTNADNSGCALWIDGATINSYTIANYGQFRISSGNMTVTGAGLVPRTDGAILIEGGNLVATKIRPSNVTTSVPRGSLAITGGTVSLNTPGLSPVEGFSDHAVLMMPFADASFIMSGGILNVYCPPDNNTFTGAIVINSSAGNINVTGGTVNVTIAGPTYQVNNANICSSAPFYNLNIYKAITTAGLVTLNDQPLGTAYTFTGYPTTIPSKPLTVLNKLYIDGVNSPILNLGGQSLYITKDAEIASGGNLVPNNGAVYFNGSTTQNVLLNGSVSGIVQNLTVNNFSSNPVLLQGSLSVLSVNGFNLTSGQLSDGGKTIKITGSISNSGRHYGNGKIELVGTAIQTITGNGSGIFGNVDLNNTNSSVDGVMLTANTTIRNSLRMVSNKAFNIQIYKLRLDSSSTQNCIVTAIGAAFSSSKFIKTAGNQSDGGVELFALGNGIATYPIGTGSFYTPAIVTFSGISSTSNQGYVQLSVNNAVLSTLATTSGTNTALLYNWRIRSSNFVAAPNVQFSFNSSVAGIWPTGTVGSPNNFVGGRVVVPNRFAETTTVTTNGLIAIASHVLPTDANYTAAQSQRFAGTVRIFYSRNSAWGDGAFWDDANTWSFTSNIGAANTGGQLPGSSDVVYIGYGNTGSGTGPFCCGPGNGDPHWTAIRYSTTVAGVVFQDLPLVGAWSAAVYMGDNINVNLGTVSNTTSNSSGYLIYNVYTAANRANLFADLGAYNLNTKNFIYYIWNTDGSVDFQPGISSFPSVRIEGSGGSTSGSKIFNMPATNIVINGDLQMYSRGSVMTFSSVSGANIEVKGNVFMGGNEGDAEIRFPTTGSQKTLKVGGDLYIWVANSGSSANFGISVVNSTPSSLTHTLQVGGNIYQAQGRFDLFNGNNPTDNNCVLEFIGTTSGQYLSFGGTTPDLYKMTMNKGSSQAPNFTFSNLAYLLGDGASTVKPITFQNGSLILNNAALNFNLSAGGGTVNIPSTSALIVANGSTVNMSSATGIVLDGLLRIQDNSVANFNDGTNNTYIEYSSSGNSRLEVLGSASLNVGGQIRRSLFSSGGTLQYVQNGGNVTVSGLNQVATNGKFELDNAGSSISMTGGNIYIQRGGGNTQFGDLYLDPGTANISGGNFILSPLTAIGSQSYRIISSSLLNNISLLSGGTSSATGTLLVYPLRVANDLVIGTSSSLNANSFGLESRGNTSIIGSYLPTTNTTSFTGSGLQNLVMNTATTFNNVIISKSNILSLSGVNAIVNGSLNLLNGTLDDGGLSITSNSDITNNAIHTGTGKIIMAGTTLPKTVYGNGSGIFQNIDVNNTNGANFNAAFTVNGKVNFVGGGIYVGSNALSLGLNSSIAGFTSSRFIRTNGVTSDDGIVKQFPATAFDFTFPLGVFGKYTPSRYTATSNTASGAIRVIPVNNAHPLTTDPANKQLEYYWVVTSTGFSGLAVNHVYNYSSTDVTGNINAYQAGRSIFGDWAPNYGGFASSIGGVNVLTSQITLSGVNFIFGEYTAGEPSELQQVLTYYSRDATLGGNWDDINTWSTDQILKSAGSVVASGLPPYGQPIVVKAGHTVLTNGNQREAYSTSISGIIDLNTTYGHNFGIMSGAGTLRLQSNPSLLYVMPAGQLSAFISTATGGTFEFYGSNDGSLPAMNPPDFPSYNNVLISGSSTKQITSSSPNYVINGSLSITGGVLQNFAGNNILVSKDWINAVGIAGFNRGFTPTSYVAFNGSNQRITGNNVFGGVQITGGGTKTFTANNTVNGILNLTSGIIDIGSNILSMETSSGVVSGGSTGSFVKGFLQKNYFTSGSNVTNTFEVGDGGFSPVSVTYASVSTQGRLAVKATAAAQPQAASSCISPTKYVNRYWTITSTSPIILPSNYSATATFLAADILGGANTSLFIPAFYTNSVWTLPGVGSKTSTSTQATALTYYGDLIVGEPKSAVGVTIVGPAMPVCAGTVLNFTALGINGGTAPGYNWMKISSGTTTTGIATTQVFTTATGFLSGDVVKARYTSSDVSCVFNNPALSNDLTVTYGTSAAWIGVINSDWSNGGNWCGGLVPGITSDLNINSGTPFSPILTSTGYVRNITFGSGSSFSLPGNVSFNIYGNFSNSGTFNPSTLAAVNFNGSSLQSIGGSTNTSFYNVNLNSASGVSFTTPQSIFGTLNFADTNADVTSNGNLILGSNANGTGRIGVLQAGNVVSGNVTVQNYMGAKINARLLSFPVQNAAISQLKSNIWVTGIGTGFDAGSTTPTIYTYVESVTGSINYGKTRISSTASLLLPGTGYEILVRSRSLNVAETRANQPMAAVTLNVTGVLNQGNISLPLSYSNTGNATADGWNLVGNPYPSQVDWAGAGWTKTKITNNIYFLDPGSSLTSATSLRGQAYTYLPGIGCSPAVAGCNSLIAQGQGFYVLATASGASLSLTEAVKTGGSSRRNFRIETVERYDLIRVSINGTTGLLDETIVRLGDNYTDSYDNGNDDVLKFSNSILNVSTRTKEGYSVVMNSTSIEKEEKVIPVEFSSTQGDSYTVAVDATSLSASMPEVYIRDNTSKTETKVTGTGSVSFTYSLGDSTAKNKYSLVLRKAIVNDTVAAETPTSVTGVSSTTGIGSSTDTTGTTSVIDEVDNKISIYPNPWSGNRLVISVKDASVEINAAEIYNSLGYRVYLSSALKYGTSNEVLINGLNLPAGTYFVKMYLKGGKTLIKKMVKI